MERVRDDQPWTLFDPADTPDLNERYGDDFNAAYIRLESSGLGRETISARKLWDRIITEQIETGTPYMLYRDAINRTLSCVCSEVLGVLIPNCATGKSNHRNLGVINSGNLCTEIVQFSSPTDTAVCTLASLRLDVFVDDDENFNFAELHRVTKIVVRNTDRIVDINSYPTAEAQASAQNTRALGIGVQGLADVFMMLRLPFESTSARLLNRAIFETIYHAAVDASCDLARQKGPYPAWSGSPASELQLQFDLWNSRPSSRYDFDSLKARIRKYGLRNSLLTAQMPTSATSHITGVNDGTDPFLRYNSIRPCNASLTTISFSNLYVRRTLDGEFEMTCKWLVRELIYLDLWTEDVRHQLIRNHGKYPIFAFAP